MLKVEGLTVRFGGLTAVRDLSFSVEPQEILAIIGPNGAGKTTVFNVLSGFTSPSQGVVRFLGEDLKEPLSTRALLRWCILGIIASITLLALFHLQTIWTEAVTGLYVYQKPFPWGLGVHAALTHLVPVDSSDWLVLLIGSVLGAGSAFVVWNSSRYSAERSAGLGLARTFQNIRLFPTLTVKENILVALENASSNNTGQRADELAALTNLTSVTHLSASSLSYGLQRRLEIARALACAPKVLLLDEPAAGLNPRESVELMDLVRSIRSCGVTVVLIEHDMKLVMAISDRIIVLDHGEKIAEGIPSSIQKNPAVIRAYLGGTV